MTRRAWFFVGVGVTVGSVSGIWLAWIFAKATFCDWC